MKVTILYIQVTVIFFVAASTTLIAELNQMAGNWHGELTTPYGELSLILTIEESSSGSLAVPSKGLSGLSVSDLKLTKNNLFGFKFPIDHAAFEGVLVSKDQIKGIWTQGEFQFPLIFTRANEEIKVSNLNSRKQTPIPPFPYIVKDLNVVGSERLACTLTRPENAKQVVPGAILLTVAGKNDRDQTHSSHKPYMVLADHLTRSGIAVLRCDDRGVGGSSGELKSSSIEDLASDALSMVQFLSNLKGIGAVGLIGNSEGAVVASLAATKKATDVAFVILLGGVGVSGAEVIKERILSYKRDTGESENAINKHSAMFDELVKIVNDAGGIGVEKLAKSKPALYQKLSKITKIAGAKDPLLPTDFNQRLKLFASPWYYSQLTLNGGNILKYLNNVPVLALTGSKDKTNLPKQNLPAIKKALDLAGNKDFNVTEIPNLNHLFQTALIGGLAEYSFLEESFSPVALKIITKWITQRFIAPVDINKKY